MKDDDFIDRLFVANTHDTILCFSNRGRAYWLKVYEVPEGTRGSRGKPIVNLFPLFEGEKITAVLPVKEFDEDHLRVHGDLARHGQENARCPTSPIRARRGSSRSASMRTTISSACRLPTAAAMSCCFPTPARRCALPRRDVRPMGRNARGVRGMQLEPGQQVISMLVAEDETWSVLTATENGYGKRTPIGEYTRHGRGTKGMIAIQSSERNGKLVAAGAGQAER